MEGDVTNQYWLNVSTVVWECCESKEGDVLSTQGYHGIGGCNVARSLAGSGTRYRRCDSSFFDKPSRELMVLGVDAEGTKGSSYKEKSAEKHIRNLRGRKEDLGRSFRVLGIKAKEELGKILYTSLSNEEGT